MLKFAYLMDHLSGCFKEVYSILAGLIRSWQRSLSGLTPVRRGTFRIFSIV